MSVPYVQPDHYEPYRDCRHDGVLDSKFKLGWLLVEHDQHLSQMLRGGGSAGGNESNCDSLVGKVE